MNDSDYPQHQKPIKYVARFAGDAFLNESLGPQADGPRARKLTSEIAWKQPPSSKLKGELSV